MCEHYCDTLDETAEYQFKILHQSLSQISSIHSILSLSYISSPITSEINSAKIDFHHTADSVDLIESAVLYIPKLDLVIDTNSYNTYSSGDYSMSSLLSFHNTSDATLLFFDNVESFSNVFFVDDSIVISRGFPLNNPDSLATIFYIIDLNAFYERLGINKLDSSQIYVFDSENHFLFSDLSDIEEDLALDMLLAAQTGEEAYGDSLLFYNQSELLGWKFLYVVDGSAATASLVSSIAEFIPGAVGILFFALLLSVLLSCWLYQPFRSLISVMQTGEDHGSASAKNQVNEFDYFYQAYDSLLQQKEHTAALMTTVSSDITQRLFLNLFSGVQLSLPEISRYLSQIQCPFDPNDYFKVMAIQLDKSMDDSNSRATFRDQIKKIAARYSSDSADVELIIPEPNIITLVFIFPRNISFVMSKKVVATFQDEIRKLLETSSVQAKIGVGRFCSPILDVGYSYKEALQNAGKNDEKAENETPQNNASAAVNVANDFGYSAQHRAQQIIHEVNNGNLTNAITLSDRVIDSISHNFDHSPEDRISAYKTFSNALNEQIMASISYTDMQNFPSIDPLLVGASDSYDTTFSDERLKEMLSGLITAYSKARRRQQNQYLTAAKNYIQEHFDNPDLTLNLCAEETGTAPSYLSRLFKTILDVSFNNYVNNLRVEHSKVLLTKTDLSVSQIAQQSGFNSSQSYIRVFKAFTGQTPGNYRKQ
ncbi:MAG: helix-turn-helix domain-containing protein [Lachnospiraceae bacterium]|nr:helix-turn-helix domain-containing protein [Lachnospiraceae bacterium]